MIDDVGDHLQRHLGVAVGDWQHAPDGEELPFQVVHFERTPGTAVEVYTTLGLSEYELGPEKLRVELMMIAPLALPEGAIPPILVHVGEMPIDADEVPRLGDVFADVQALQDISPMTCLYVGRPVYQAPEFALLDDGSDRIAFLWLIPVYDSEAQFIENEGWEAFERLMWDLDVDPTDFDRVPWVD